MDANKVFLGIALIAFSAALVINPANAAASDSSCSVGIGNLYLRDCTSAAVLPEEPEYTAYSRVPAICDTIPEKTVRVCRKSPSAMPQ